MRRWLSSPIAIALLLSTARAHANPSARLVYVRGPGAQVCPNEDAVRAAVATRLGYDPFFPSAPTTIFVELAGSGDRFVAQVKLVDSEGVERGTRRLASPKGRCLDLVGTLALTISLVVDPLSLAPAPPPRDSQDPPAPAPPAEGAPASAASIPPLVSDAESPAASSAPPVSALRYFAGVSLLGSLGSALAPTAGAAAFGGARRDWLSVRIEGRGDLPASATSPPAARSWALVASASPCAHWRSAFACATLGVESIQASGDATTARSAETLVAIVGGRLGAEMAATDHLVLAPFAEVLAPLQRPRIQIDGIPVHWFSPVAADVGISGVVRF